MGAKIFNLPINVYKSGGFLISNSVFLEFFGKEKFSNRKNIFQKAKI